MRDRVLIATGSSGGHIFPALAFREALREIKPECEVVLVLPEQRSVPALQLADDTRVVFVSTQNPRKGFSVRSLRSLALFFKGCFQSALIVARFKPDVVVGFGSLVAFPPVIFGWFFRRETLIHEQNVIPGKANRLLAKFVDKVAVSFPETVALFSCRARKIVVTGNPIRKSLCLCEKSKALSFFGFAQGFLTILVSGGSQGSLNINAGFIRALEMLEYRERFQVLHLSGGKDSEGLKKAYARLGVRVKVLDFCDAMEYAYSSADLVVSRSGATTIAELIRFKVPSILIPFPFAQAHQKANALVLERAGVAMLVEDGELAGEKLGLLLAALSENSEKLARMREGFAAFPPVDAGSSLVREVLAVSGISN